MARTGRDFPIIVIQEAGLDGFWIRRVLQSEGIESHVVDAASILTSRRRRRAKTDRIDGETLVRTLMAFKRGEPRVCSMARAPTPQEEDRRRVCRERRTLVGERLQQDLEPIQFADDLRLQVHRQRPAVTCPQVLQPLTPTVAQRLVAEDPLGEEQPFDPVDVRHP